LIEKPMIQNANLLQTWIWCLLKASYKEHEQMVGIQKIVLAPGQFITGRFKGASEIKMNPSTFWKYLLWLQGNESLDIKSNSKYSLVTVVNWESYQVGNKNDDNESDSKMTAACQPCDTNNKVKKDKKEKNVVIYTPDFEEFWANYPRQESKPTAFRQWQSRLKEKAVPAEMVVGAKNYAIVCRGKEPQFIKLPATFIGRDKHWKDYIEGGSLFGKTSSRGYPGLGSQKNTGFESGFKWETEFPT
jgi:hypothetical protein